MQRFSSRRQQLAQRHLGDFLSEKLQGAVSYDRIAGFFRSSMLEVAGEKLELLEGKARVICNSELNIKDVETAKLAQQALRRAWCGGEPEKLIEADPELAKDRFARLFSLLSSQKLEVKVLPDQAFGLIHGKAGVITYADGAKTSFLGSTNESLTAWKINYELLWEDDSPEAVQWVQEEFDALWSSPMAVPLAEFIIDDIKRLSHRSEISTKIWLEDHEPDPAPAVVETPIFRKEFGLWAHQKYFIKKAFEEHCKSSARFILADQVGLGKTVQLALSALLMALHGDKPVLVIVPKPVVVQWQDELRDLLGMPSAVWSGKQWIDENGLAYPSKGAESVKQCPRRIGILSQGLIVSGSEVNDYLKAMKFECVIVDEAHRARRKSINPNSLDEKVEPNNLMQFIFDISPRTKSLLLATATPVQLHPIEAWDMLTMLGCGNEQVLGNAWSEWRQPAKILPIVLGEKPFPGDPVYAWPFIRNPLPPASEHRTFREIRRRLRMSDSDYVAAGDARDKLRTTDYTKLNRVLHHYGRKHNPFIRHIIRRTRDYLESQIDPATGEPYLAPVKVKLFGEDERDALELPLYLRDAYELAQEFCQLLGRRMRSAGLFKTLLLRRIGSSMYAGQQTVTKLLGKRYVEDSDQVEAWSEEDEETDDRNRSSLSEELTFEEIQILQRCKTVLENNQERDPKYQQVVEYLIDKNWLELGCIIFSQYYDSVQWLANLLSTEHLVDEQIGIYAGASRSGLFHQGNFTRCDRERIKQMVKSGELRLIIGTDAASEGLNLQRLGTLINLDLPWNPTRLEQRKGRIQRIGQIGDEVWILNMRYRDSVEDRVHELLSNRLADIFQLFGQIPDVLEDVWVEVALGEEIQAQKLIENIKPKHPFDEKYSAVEDIDWESCSRVLRESDKTKILRQGW